MTENGLTEQWLTDIFNYNRKKIGTIDQKLKDPINEFNVIALTNVVDLFYVLDLSLFISFSVLIIEQCGRI